MSKQLSIFEQLEFSTTRIEAKDAEGKTWSGSGFFFNLDLETDNHQTIPLIITNKHVVENAAQLIIQFSKSTIEGYPIYEEPYKIVMSPMPDVIYHPDPEVDLCGIPYNPLVMAINNSGMRIFHKWFDNSLIPNQENLKKLDSVEDIIMIGYPNGMWDSYHNLPIVRKGITATPAWVDFNGKKEFLIDAACFPGSSGSPILLCNIGQYTDKMGNTYLGGNRIYLLGILYGGPQLTVTGEIKVIEVPAAEKTQLSLTRIPNNLGYVISSQRILDLIKVIKECSRGS